MAEASVTFLLNNLWSLVEHEHTLLGGFRSTIKSVKGEFEHMTAFLRAVDSTREVNQQLGEWVKQVREIAYDIEDVLDNYMLRFSNNAIESGNCAPIKNAYESIIKIKYRHQIASEIQEINARVINAYKSYEMYRGSSRIPTRSAETNHGRGYALLLEEADVVGIENPKSQLLKIISADCKLKVISVVGMGGSGKTTLVKKVYDDKFLIKKFDYHLWISVSESYEIDNLLRKMINLLLDEIKQSKPYDLDSMDVDKMREFIYKFLLNKTYIIVFDDIWQMEAWERIKYVFPRSTTSGQGCIIITTQNITIANAVVLGELNGHVHQIEPLPEAESKTLFYRKAFGSELACPSELENISRTILLRCAGWPLAIVVIGALLATKEKNPACWENFDRSIGSEFSLDYLKRMKMIISISFLDLPYHLQLCFRYLSIFPRGQILERWRLIRLWIAQGYVQKTPERTLEEVAEEYFQQLLNRCLIVQLPTAVPGKQNRYRLHDLFREYLISISRQEILVTSDGNYQWHEKVRRVAIDASLPDIPESCKLRSLRSLLYFGSGDAISGGILLKVLRSGCRLLKELDLRGAPIEVIPDEVFKLCLLKYLSLRRTKVKLIPKGIKNLHNLETLDLKATCVTQLPIEVLKLRKLRHLLVYSYVHAINGLTLRNVQGFSAPYKIGSLSSLQRLVGVNADEVHGVNIVREIGELTQLQRLGITNVKKEDGNDLCSSLARMSKLNSLLICSNNEMEGVIDLQHLESSVTTPLKTLRCLVLEGRLEKIPLWINSSLDCLKILHVRWSRLEEDPLERFQGLPNLEDLCMDRAYEGDELNFKVGGFQKLKALSLLGLQNLVKVTVNGSLPNLEKLCITDCSLVVNVPEGVEHLPNLQIVEFIEMSKDFVDGLHDAASEKRYVWTKLNHISRFYVSNWDNSGEYLRGARRLRIGYC